MLKKAITRLQLSGRAYGHILKVARMAADVAGSTLLATPLSLFEENCIFDSNNSMNRLIRFPHSALLLPLVCVSLLPPLQAQTYIRRLWQADFGTPVFTDWSTSLWTTDHKLITVGNTLSQYGNPGMLTTVQNAEGQILWSKTWIHPGSLVGNSYGICMTVDSSGHIYAAGATRDSTTTDFDMAVVKYNSAGAELWSILLGDTGDDYPIALAFIPGDTLLYLTGASAATNDTLDYLTIQLSANTGEVVWEKRYDHAGLEDVPVALSIDGSGNVVVTGGSASEPGNWEIATLKYGKSSGSLVAERREGLESSLDQPAGLVKDTEGNFISAETCNLSGNRHSSGY